MGLKIVRLAIKSEGLASLYLCPVGPSTTDVPHPGASTLISAPWSNLIGQKGSNLN